MDLQQLKNDYKLPDGFPKDVTEKLYKKNDFKWAAENRDKILEKMGKKSLVKKQNRKSKVSRREKKMSEYLSIQHIQKQFDAFTALKDISFTVKKMSLYVY